MHKLIARLLGTDYRAECLICGWSSGEAHKVNQRQAMNRVAAHYDSRHGEPFKPYGLRTGARYQYEVTVKNWPYNRVVLSRIDLEP